jgi:hypothetical protein
LLSVTHLVGWGKVNVDSSSNINVHPGNSIRKTRACASQCVCLVLRSCDARESCPSHGIAL